MSTEPVSFLHSCALAKFFFPQTLVMCIHMLFLAARMSCEVFLLKKFKLEAFLTKLLVLCTVASVFYVVFI